MPQPGYKAYKAKGSALFFERDPVFLAGADAVNVFPVAQYDQQAGKEGQQPYPRVGAKGQGEQQEHGSPGEGAHGHHFAVGHHADAGGNGHDADPGLDGHRNAHGGGHALAALEFQKGGEVMAQDSPQGHAVAADGPAQAAADQHGGHPLEEIPHEGQQPAFEAEHPKHIGAAGIPAAMFPHVVVMQQVAEHDGELEIAQQVPQQQAYEIDFNGFNKHNQIIPWPPTGEKAHARESKVKKLQTLGEKKPLPPSGRGAACRETPGGSGAAMQFAKVALRRPVGPSWRSLAHWASASLLPPLAALGFAPRRL